MNLIVDAPDLFPDNPIMSTSRHCTGRIQNHKNWSPHMVPDPSKTSLGLEYFCSSDEPLWTMDDDALIAMATEEFARRGRRSPVSMAVVRAPRAYRSTIVDMRTTPDLGRLRVAAPQCPPHGTLRRSRPTTGPLDPDGAAERRTSSARTTPSGRSTPRRRTTRSEAERQRGGTPPGGRGGAGGASGVVSDPGAASGMVLCPPNGGFQVQMLACVSATATARTAPVRMRPVHGRES